MFSELMYDELQKRAAEKTDKINALAKRAREVIVDINAGHYERKPEFLAILDEIIKEGNDKEAKDIKEMQIEVLKMYLKSRKS